MTSVSATFASRMSVAPTRCPPLSAPGLVGRVIRAAPKVVHCGGSAGLVIECSSRPNKKGTAHHKKTRPRKTAPWDIRRKGPTAYAPPPPLPPDWSLVSDDSATTNAADAAAVAASSE